MCLIEEVKSCAFLQWFSQVREEWVACESSGAVFEQLFLSQQVTAPAQPRHHFTCGHRPALSYHSPCQLCQHFYTDPVWDNNNSSWWSRERNTLIQQSIIIVCWGNMICEQVSSMLVTTEFSCSSVVAQRVKFSVQHQQLITELSLHPEAAPADNC